MKILIGFAGVLIILACQTFKSGERAPSAEISNPESQPLPELGETWTPENDHQAAEIVQIFRGMLEDKMKTEKVVHRDAHPKQHACLTAQVNINPEKLPAELRVGLYKEKSQHDAWIRFSNGDPKGTEKPDIEADIRGMAVKILNVAGSPSGNHDLVMINSERFFSRDGNDYLDLSQSLTGGGAKMAWYFARNPKNASIILKARQKITSSLDTTYFSSVIYKLGPRSMRFQVIPCAQNSLFKDLPKNPSANYLRERIVQTVAQQDSCFDLYVQPNMEPQKNIVENPTNNWDQKKSPLVSVGRILIPKQKDPTSKEQMAFCENISMDPWRSLPENRPLGQINRIRKLVYPEISKFRHNANRIPVMEPTSLNPCQGETAPLCQEP